MARPPAPEHVGRAAGPRFTKAGMVADGRSMSLRTALEGTTGVEWTPQVIPPRHIDPGSFQFRVRSDPAGGDGAAGDGEIAAADPVLEAP
jgi:hypothetical protein